MVVARQKTPPREVATKSTGHQQKLKNIMLKQIYQEITSKQSTTQIKNIEVIEVINHSVKPSTSTTKNDKNA